jgi:hypothetical protein
MGLAFCSGYYLRAHKANRSSIVFWVLGLASISSMGVLSLLLIFDNGALASSMGGGTVGGDLLIYTLFAAGIPPVIIWLASTANGTFLGAQQKAKNT